MTHLNLACNSVAVYFNQLGILKCWLSNSCNVEFTQVSLEGKIAKDSIANILRRGIRSGGDLIPWTIDEQVCFIAFVIMMQLVQQLTW